MVAVALRGYPTLASVVVAPCAGTGDQTGYRTRLKWAVDGARIGLFGQGHEVVDTPECAVAPQRALEIAAALRTRPPESGARLGALDIRVTAEGTASAVLVVEARDARAAEVHANGLLSRLPRGLGVAWAWRRPDAVTLLGGRPERLAGETTLRDRVGLVAARFPAGAFSQAHRGQTAVLHRWLRAAVAGFPGARVADLFAGTGGLGLAVADLCSEVLLVEPFAPAADAARSEAPRNTHVFVGTAERALSELDHQGAIFILDPPRTGLTGAALSALIRARPKAVVMVSCEPRTFARDLAVLSTYGWATSEVRPLDLMPRTSQVEAFALAVPGPPAGLTVLATLADGVVVQKPPFLPTVPHPEWPSSALNLVQRDHPDYQPAHRLDAGTSGVVLFSRRGSGALEGAEKTYTALVRGIVRRHGTLRQPLDERGERLDAETRFERVAVVGGHSLVRVRLVTGRTHQIRRHFAGIGNPVLGDDRYGDPRSDAFLFARHGLHRPFLHAEELVLATGERVTCPLAPDLAMVLESLRSAGHEESD